MSIHIGTLPVISPTDKPFTVSTNRSNISRFTTDNHVYMEFDNFRIGQTSNNESDYYFTVEDIPSNERIISFSKENISFWKPISSTEEIKFDNQVIITSNLQALEIDADKILLTDGSYVPITLSNDGSMFLEGLLTADFVNITDNLQANTIYTNSISFSNTSTIFFTNSNMILDADTVELRNVFFPGLVNMEDVNVSDRTQLNGQVVASNILLFNKPGNHPLQIRQKLFNDGINERFSTTDEDPISIIADFPNNPNTRILQFTHRGHLVMGGTPNTPSEYMIRCFVSRERDQFLTGFVSFTNSNTQDSFIINRNANVSIGNPASASMFEVRNNYAGTETYYVKPESLVTLQNKQATNQLPYLIAKTPTDTTRFQFTSNGTLSFLNTPLNMFKYDIETSNACFFGDIEVNSIKANKGSIDLSSASLSNVESISANNASLSNAYIYSLTVDNLFTDSLDCFETLNDPLLLKVLSTRFLINSSNIVINKNRNFISSSNALTNDNILLYTNGTAADTVRNLYTIGTNNAIIERTENNATAIGTRVVKEMSANQNNFQIGVRNRDTSIGINGNFFISPNNNNTDNNNINDFKAAINIDRDRVIKFGSAAYIAPDGRVTINQDSLNTAYNLYTIGNAAFINNTGQPSLEITSTGNVGIGTTAGARRLTVNGTANFIGQNNVSLLRLDNASVGFGTTVNRFPYHVNLDSTFTNPVSCLSNVTIHGRLDTLGNVASTSDATLKTNLQPIQSALAKLETLTGYIYERIDTKEKETGLLAQDVIQVLPEAVHQGANGYYHLAYGNMAGLIVESIKELSSRVKSLEALVKENIGGMV